MEFAKIFLHLVLHHQNNLLNEFWMLEGSEAAEIDRSKFMGWTLKSENWTVIIWGILSEFSIIFTIPYYPVFLTI